MNLILTILQSFYCGLSQAHNNKIEMRGKINYEEPEMHDKFSSMSFLFALRQSNRSRAKWVPEPLLAVKLTKWPGDENAQNTDNLATEPNYLCM